MSIHALASSATAEHYTPREWINRVHAVMGGIDTDPASCAEAQETVGAARWFGAEDDGLSKYWRGRVFCNPPGDRSGKLVQSFWRHLDGEILDGRVTEFIWLAFNISQLRTLQQVGPLLSYCDVFVPSKRIRFSGASPTRDNAFLYWGQNRGRFRRIFSEAGGLLLQGVVS